MKKATYHQAKILKSIDTDRELNCGSNELFFVNFGRFSKKLCQNPLTKSGVLRRLNYAHEPFEKLKNRKARTRKVLTLE